MIEIHVLRPAIHEVSANRDDVVRAQEGSRGYINCRRPKVGANLKRQSRLVDQ